MVICGWPNFTTASRSLHHTSTYVFLNRGERRQGGEREGGSGQRRYGCLGDYDTAANQRSQFPKSSGGSSRPYSVFTGDFKGWSWITATNSMLPLIIFKQWEFGHVWVPHCHRGLLLSQGSDPTHHAVGQKAVVCLIVDKSQSHLRAPGTQVTHLFQCTNVSFRATSTQQRMKPFQPLDLSQGIW